MAQLKARIARVSAAYEPGWGREVERQLRRAALGVAIAAAAVQFL